jgi:hypothetical protein
MKKTAESSLNVFHYKSCFYPDNFLSFSLISQKAGFSLKTGKNSLIDSGVKLNLTAMKKLFFLMISLATMMTSQLYGQAIQDTTLLYNIDTKDGNEFLGHIMFRDTSLLIFKTESYGNITIRKDNVKKLELINQAQIKEGKIWIENYQDSRYFFSPNGYGLRKGEAYYQNVWVLYNQVSVGGTKNFSIGGGIVPLFLFAGAPTPVWVIPKVSIPIVKNKFNIGAGALVGYVLGEDGTGFGILYGTLTGGSRDKNVSLGVGYGFFDGEFAKKPIINLCVLIRTSPRSYFMSENYYVPFEDGSMVLFSLGGRSIIKRIGLDYGLFVPFSSDIDSFVAIPWLGVTVPLGKAKAGTDYPK